MIFIIRLCILFICLNLSFPSSGFPRHNLPSKTLHLYNCHTHEQLKVIYFQKGSYNRAGLNKLNYFLRDWRTQEVKEIDINLLDFLYLFQQESGTRRPIRIISGYRSPRTNNRLAQRSTQVSKESFHMLGRAIDVCLQDIPLDKQYQIAKNLKLGGVGYYPKSHFIHIDTGPVRCWSGS